MQSVETWDGQKSTAEWQLSSEADLWSLDDLKAPAEVTIPADGKSISCTLQIPHDYFAGQAAQDILQKSRRSALIATLKSRFNLQIRSRLAQYGLDGKVDFFSFKKNQLMVTMSLRSLSGRAIHITANQGIVALYSEIGTRPYASLRLGQSGELIQSDNAESPLARIQGGALERGVLTSDEFRKVLDTAGYKSERAIPAAPFVYIKLSPDWQTVQSGATPLSIPNGSNSREFRAEIDQNLTNFTTGQARFLVGETCCHIEFVNQRVLLRQEIVGIPKNGSDKLKVIRQTNSLRMQKTSWGIRVEVVPTDDEPFTPEMMAEYDWYMFLEFLQPNELSK